MKQTSLQVCPKLIHLLDLRLPYDSLVMVEEPFNVASASQLKFLPLRVGEGTCSVNIFNLDCQLPLK
jgi:hypothetical protein